MSGNSYWLERRRKRLRSSGFWVEKVLIVGTLIAAGRYQPVEALLRLPKSTSGLPWRDATVWLICACFVKTVWTHTFRAEENKAERRALRAALLADRLPHMDIRVRIAGLLMSLGFLLLVSSERHPDLRGHCLAWSLFALFVLIELSILLVPSESMLPKPSDEFLIFLRARVARAGFLTALVGLFGVAIAASFGGHAASLATPVGIAAGVLVPSVILRRLEQEADAES